MTRPTKFPRWATVPSVDPVVGGSNVVEPTEQQKDDGWKRKQKPPANYQNWLHNLTYEWLLYLDDIDAEGLPKNYRSGMILVNNSVDPLKDIDFGAGKWRSNDDTTNLELAAIMTKKIDAPWAAGTNEGGFPSGLVLAVDTWYHCFSIGKEDGTTDAGFDTSLSAANLKADATGYTKIRRVGSIKTEAATTNIRKFIQYDNLFLWDTPGGADFTGGTGAADTITLTTPPDIKVNAYIFVEITSNIAGGTFTVSLYMSSLDVADLAPIMAPMSMQYVKDGTDPTSLGADLYVVTNELSQIRGRINTINNTSYAVGTKGWIDFFDNL